MWKRKTNEEIRYEEEKLENFNKKNIFKKSAKRSLYTFFGILIFLILNAIFFDPELIFDRPGLSKPISLAELPHYILYYTIFSLIWSLIVFFASLFKPQYLNRRKNSSVICNRCYKTKNIDNSKNCTCGGYFENIEFYTWFEDSINDDESWINKYKIMKNEA